MRCPKCGVELPDNAKFCFNCGEKIEGELKKNEETKNNKTYLDGEDFVGNSKLSVGKNLGSMIVDFWNELNSYGKIVVISLMLYSLLF